MNRSIFVPLAIVATCVIAAATVRAQATIEALPIAPDSSYTKGFGVSGDGTTIVGVSGNFSVPFAQRWSGGTMLGLGTLPGFSQQSQAYDVSRDGSVIVGVSKGVLYGRAFRWTSAGMTELPMGAVVNGVGSANGISADGKVIVGAVPAPISWNHACVWDDGGLRILGTIDDMEGDSSAEACSEDGNVIVGMSASTDAFTRRAFRWENGVMEDLGTPEGPEGYSFAHDVSADGSVVVGTWNAILNDGFRWTREDGMEALPAVDNVRINVFAYGVSGDGRTIVGHSSHSFSRTGGTACVWRDGQARQLWDLLKGYGVNPDAQGWSDLYEVTACSADGSVLTGVGRRRPAVGQPYSETPFRVTIPPLNYAPTIDGSIPDGSVVVAREGGLVTVEAEAWDRNPGDDLTLDVEGLPAGATLTPPAGTKKIGTQQAPFEATFEWTPGESEVGSSHDVTISFRDETNVRGSLSFTIEVVENDAPTVDPMTPKSIECVDGQHLVALSTVVDDPQNDPLTATWSVNGDVVKTENVEAGEEVAYSGDYEHGENVVELVVSDGILEMTATTTVTVEDTQDPTITVTPQVKLSTDRGKAFASKSRLVPPTAEDATGHAVAFSNDAPATLSLGEHVLTWTATDIGGNQVTATQTVEVVDREKPKIGALPAIESFCDPGKTYATVRLKKPTATDNVPGKIRTSTTAGTEFPIGTTKVVWTARDAAGNVARKTQKVTVVNRKPTANAGRDVTITTNSDRGAKVDLNGGASSDIDKHQLTFGWTAGRVKLSGATSSKASGLFPVGTTTVTLTVTDAGKAKDTDTVRVTVKLKNGRSRPRGAQANDAFAAAAVAAAHSATAGRSSSNGASLQGAVYASAAAGLGDAAGGVLQWDEGQSDADAFLHYAALRALQKAYGEAAAAALLSAYAETGDPGLLAAYRAAAEGVAYAEADLTNH